MFFFEYLIIVLIKLEDTRVYIHAHVSLLSVYIYHMWIVQTDNV